MLDRSVVFALLRDSLVAGYDGMLRTLLSGVYRTVCDIDRFDAADPLLVQLRGQPHGIRLALDLPMTEDMANAVAQRLISLRSILEGARGNLPPHLLSLGDGGVGADISFSSDHPEALLIPDPQFIESDGYAEVRTMFAAAPAWADRRPQALWRGSTTGTRAVLDDVFSLPRLRLCEQTRGQPMFDCAIAGDHYLFQMDEIEKERVKASGLVGDEVPLSRIIDYQVNIDIDGNTNSWPGLFCKLLAGSPVVKVASNYRQWYYDRLIPFENYIPTASDLSDIERDVSWCLSHPEEAEAIGQRGRELALSLTAEAEIARARASLFADCAG